MPAEAPVVTAPVTAPVSTTSTTSSSGPVGEQHSDSGQGTGEQSTSEAIKSIKVSFDAEGEGEDFSLTDETPAAEPEFKFEQLDAIKEEHAELYKTLKAELSKGARFSKTTGFKTPEEAKGHFERIGKIEKVIGERADGKKGLDSIEATIGELASDLTKIQSGDPQLLQNWFKSNPAGMSQTAQKIMESWAQADQQGFTAAHAKLAFAALAAKDAGGVSCVDALNKLYTAIGDNPAARALIERVAYTVNNISKNAEYKPDEAPLLAQKEADLKTREANIWNRETDAQILPIITGYARKGLSSLLTGLKKEVAAEDRAEFTKTLTDNFFKRVGQDGDFVTRLNSLRNQNDRDGIIGLVKSVHAKHMREALKDLYREKLLDRKGARAEGAEHTEAGGGSASGDNNIMKYTGAMYAGAPKVQYDYPRMKAENPNMLEDHQFYIVGKKAKYRW